VHADGSGSYVWLDGDDDRVLLAPDGLDVELRSLRVTGSNTHLSVLVELASLPGAGQAAQLQLAIDTDFIADSGERSFLGASETRVRAEVAWEHLVLINLNPAPSARIQSSSGAQQNVLVQTLTTPAFFVELTLPWSALQLSGPPGSPLRFTTATFRTDSAGSILDVETDPNALDAVTDYGSPKVYKRTASEFFEVDDDVIDYYVSLHFDANGQPRSPLQIQAFRPNPGSGMSEWIAIRNQTDASYPLAAHKLGDEEDPKGNEGMLAFPASVALQPQQIFAVATNGLSFSTEYGLAPGAELMGGSGAPVMQDFNEWGASNISLNNQGDQILLLDPSNTILDVISYGVGADSIYPTVQTGPSLAVNAVASRDALGRDTDDCSVDFVVASNPCTVQTDCSACDICMLGVCIQNPAGEGVLCDDGDPCTHSDSCSNNVCAGTPLECVSDSCMIRECDGTPSCLQTPLPNSTLCAQQSCPADRCELGSWRDFSESCALFCSEGVCASSCECSVTEQPCQAEGCCVAGCADGLGCHTMPGQCGTGQDSCGEHELVVDMLCTGCGPAAAAGVCEPGGSFRCDEEQHESCAAVNCGGITHYCTQREGVWAWRPEPACDDQDACSFGDVCVDGQCSGSPIVCESTTCLLRECNGTPQCLEQLAEPGTFCGEAEPCPEDHCVDGQWYDYPESCHATCNAQGECESNCDCSPSVSSCDAFGCCLGACVEGLGCVIEAGSCEGSDTCSARTLIVESYCDGCAQMGDSGTCTQQPQSFVCDGTAAMRFAARLCNGDLYYCVELDGVWGWSLEQLCDDQNPCTDGDAVTAGACVGTPLPDGTSCELECREGARCEAAQCVGGQESCSQLEDVEQAEPVPDTVESAELEETVETEQGEEVRVCGCTLHRPATPLTSGALLLGCALVLVALRRRILRN
jgi:hypothetical protein